MMKTLGFLRYVATIIVSVLAAAVIILLIPFDKNGSLFHKSAKLWARVVVFLCSIKVQLQGLENLDWSRNYVFVSNHASAFDIPAVIANVPAEIRIIYKKELERIPVFGWGLKWGPYIGIERGSKPEARRRLEDAIETIRRGASVFLYAEGTRTLNGKLLPFKRGAFNIAVRTGIPVVPLTINGSFALLPKSSFSVKPGTVEIILNKPIHLRGDNGKETELKLMEEVHRAIEATYRDQ